MCGGRVVDEWWMSGRWEVDEYGMIGVYEVAGRW